MLGDGRLLVAGGYAGDFGGGYLASTALYDPRTRRWSRGRPMTARRDGQGAAALADGRALVAGGYDGGFLAGAELYDPATGRWRRVHPMPTARWGQTATTLADGRVLVVGGVGAGGYLSSTELYDPRVDGWTRGPALPGARDGHTATLLGDGSVLVAGGYEASGPTASAARYEPATGRWVPAAPMHHPRDGHTATPLADGSVLVAGGAGPAGYPREAELYLPAADRWVSAGQLARGREGHAAARLGDGRVLLTGGAGPARGKQLPTLASSELYEPGTRSWSPAASLPDEAERWDHALVGVGDASALFTGGNSAIFRPGASGGSRIGDRLAAAARSRRSRRPGCGTFCRQAGSVGGRPPPGEPLTIGRQAVRIGRQGVVGVRVRCLRARRCRGALLLGVAPELGRADLDIAPGRRGTVRLGLSPAGQRLVRRQRRLTALALGLVMEVRERGHGVPVRNVVRAIVLRWPAPGR